MGFNDNALTILHVEDDPALAKLVRIAFENFGFRGEMVAARSVKEALALLEERGRNQETLSLILVDMNLPDGTGLDVIREVKGSPLWQMTPVIVLSSEVDRRVIDDAYALGANSFMPKMTTKKPSLDSLRSLYGCWMEDVFLPQAVSLDRLQEALGRSIRLRSRTSDFYMELARVFEGNDDEMSFWLDRSLTEGNLSNLLAFFRTTEDDVPPGTVDRFSVMQARVNDALAAVEKGLKQNPHPSTALACRWALELTDALDEEVFAEALGCLFPVSPVATVALKGRAASQLKELAAYVLERSGEAGLREKAGALLDWSQRLMMA